MARGVKSELLTSAENTARGERVCIGIHSRYNSSFYGSAIHIIFFPIKCMRITRLVFGKCAQKDSFTH